MKRPRSLSSVITANRSENMASTSTDTFSITRRFASLIIKPPAGQGIQPSRITTPVETTSLAPTLLSLAGVKDDIERQFQSRGLFDPALKQQVAVYSDVFYPFSSFGWSPLHSLETIQYHYIEAPQPELYDIAADPNETNNLAAYQGQPPQYSRTSFRNCSARTHSSRPQMRMSI